KPMNVVVYKYPQNNKTLAHEPITEVRNYDLDYKSKERTFAKKGGRRKVVDGGGTQPEQGGVPDENRGVYPTRTGRCTEIGPNNSINNINNPLNSNNNDLNSSSNLFNGEQGEIETVENTQNEFSPDAVVGTEKHTTTIDPDVIEIIRFWDDNNFGHSIHSK